MASTFGSQAQSTKANGKTIELMVKVSFGILKVIFILDSFILTKPTASAYTSTSTAQDTKGSGSEMYRKDRERKCGRMAQDLLEHINKA